MDDYIEWVIRKDSAVTVNKEENTEHTHEGFLSELLLKRLRTIDGINLSWLETNYGTKIVEEVLDGAALGIELGLAKRTGDNVLCLTDPDG